MEEQDTMDKNLQRVLLRISHLYFTKIYQQMDGIGIHPGQIPIIKLLGYKGELSQKEISQSLHIKPPTVAVSIKRLEKSGLIERKPDTRDQRVTRVSLTEKGYYIYRTAMKQIQNNEKILFQGFTESEKCLFARFFKQIEENLERLPVDDTIKTDFKCGKE